MNDIIENDCLRAVDRSASLFFGAKLGFASGQIQRRVGDETELSIRSELCELCCFCIRLWSFEVVV